MEKLITAGLFGMMNSGTAYVIGAIVCVLVSYLIGSVNFTRIFVNKYDAFPDTMGLYKKAGGRVAFGAAALDGLKGFLCALIGLLLMPGDGYACLCTLFCLLGHAFPIWFKFKGGAGAAVYIGAALVMNPLMALAAFFHRFSVLLYDKLPRARVDSVLIDVSACCRQGAPLGFHGRGEQDIPCQ